MSLNCPKCSEAKGKLKILSCKHAFCIKCIDELKEGDTVIKCTVCNSETSLPAFGIKDLESQYSGKISCFSCDLPKELAEIAYCIPCEEPVCSTCIASSDGKHSSHSLSNRPLPRSSAFCMDQLNHLVAIHTDLTQIQKKTIREYFKKLEQAISRKFDDDLAVRIRRFKDQKRWLEDTYDVKDEDSTGEGKMRTIKMVEIFSQLSRIIPTQNAFAQKIPKEGPIFQTVKFDDMVNLLITRGKLSTFSPDHSFLRYNYDIPVSRFIGSGIINNPSDLCVISSIGAILVSSRTQGLYKFKLGDDNSLIKKIPISDEQSQLSCMDHIPGSKHGCISTLDNFREWTITLCDIETLKPEKRYPCPKTPIAKSWLRWITMITEDLVVVVTGDDSQSAVWICDLKATTWTLSHEETKATFRRAAVKVEPDHYRIYLPDMQNKRIQTLQVEKGTLKTVDVNPLVMHDNPTSLAQDMPTCADYDVTTNTICVGYWKLGHVIEYDLGGRRSPRILGKVGERELISLRKQGDNLYALCKQQELVQKFSIVAYSN